jgi:hypothetical protein
VLPTGDGSAAAGASNQYLSIWKSAGSTFAGLSGQFDGVQTANYWSGTVYAPNPSAAWVFNASIGFQGIGSQAVPFFAVAVRPGDLAAVAAVPEPETYAMMLVGLGALTLVVKRRPH